MIHQTRDEASRQLDRANACHDTNMWRLWGYVPVDNTLTLMGSRQDGWYWTFLLFRGTTYIHLPNWINRPRFSLSEIAEVAPPNLLLDEHYHAISVISGSDRFGLICREVEFYDHHEGKQPLESLLSRDHRDISNV